MLDLDAFRTQGDPLFDPLMSDVVRARAVGTVARVLRGYTRNDQPPPRDLSEPLRAQLAAAARPPAWLDHRRADRAAAFFAEHSLSMTFLLATTSLLECYAAGKGVQALYATRKMLEANLQPRIVRTGQFVLHVMAAGGFSPGGAAIPALLKVRMQHAAVRQYLVSRGGWDPIAQGGVPVCQEDQLGTLLAFAYSPLLKLRALGARVDRAAVEDMLHLWGAAGELLGLPPEWIPRTEPEADALAHAIYDRQFAPTPQGVELAAALMDLQLRLLPQPLRAPFLALVRHLAGADVYEALELPAVRHDAWIPGSALVRTLARAAWTSRAADAAASKVGIAALRLHAQRQLAAA